MKALQRLLCVLMFFSAAAARADVKLPTLVGDNMVLQRDRPVRIWGWADPGEKIQITQGGTQRDAVADDKGDWSLMLPAMMAGKIPNLVIAGKNTITLKNLLAGEVWVCSGQSNMERQLGLRPRQQPIDNWEAEVAAAKYPEIRQFGAANTIAFTPNKDIRGEWVVCSPETVADFSAVAYFFGRDLHKALHVPIGLIHSSWGGTVAEAWTSADALKKMPDFNEGIEQVATLARTYPDLMKEYSIKIEEWMRASDAGSKEGSGWEQPGVETDDDGTSRSWQKMFLPCNWEEHGLPAFDGVVWFRRNVRLPESAAGKAAALSLGTVDDQDATFINGKRVGAMFHGSENRIYKIPAGVLKDGVNTIAVRVLDTGGSGGIDGKPAQISLTVEGQEPISLSGDWLYRPGADGKLAATPPPTRPGNNQNAPTVLYNGMIAPLLPYTIKGVIWYQGESNSTRATQYRELFPLMIADWRARWEVGQFPFLFVQVAPFNRTGPEIREAQFMTLAKSPNTAMAVLTDCGAARDIHPTHKQPVGARLALAARALAYGEKIEYSGPLYASMTQDSSSAVLQFTHVGGGLRTMIDGKLETKGAVKGFELSEDNKTFLPGDAVIVGDKIHIGSAQVVNPRYVRYGWANVPDVSLFNADGLPASPFRTHPE